MQTALVMESNRVGGGAAALAAAKARGLHTIFLCRDPDEYEGQPNSPLAVADEVTVVDTTDIAKLIRAMDNRRECAAVLAYDDLSVVNAAILGHYLEAPYNPPPRAVVRSRFKDRLRASLASTPWGVDHATVPFTASTSPIGYPCVVKPADGTGTYGVSVCRNDEDLRTALWRLHELAGRTFSHGYRPLEFALVEAYLSGQEFSAEMVWSRQRQSWRTVGYTTKELSAGNPPIEVEHLFPHQFDAATAQRIDSELASCLQVLGLRDTLVHVEFRLDGDRVCLIEVNCRPAGGYISDLVRLAVGASLVELHVAAHLGDADALLDAARQTTFAGVRFLLPERSGMIDRFEIEPAAEDSVIEMVTVETPVEVAQDLTNDSYLARVIVTGDDEAQVAKLLQLHANRITACYSPVLRQTGDPLCSP